VGVWRWKDRASRGQRKEMDRMMSMTIFGMGFCRLELEKVTFHDDHLRFCRMFRRREQWLGFLVLKFFPGY